MSLSERFACVSRAIVLSFLLFHTVLFLLKLIAQFLWYLRLLLRPAINLRFWNFYEVLFLLFPFFSLFFKKFTHIEMKVWLHHLFNYLLFTIRHKYKLEPVKATESAVDIVSKNSYENVRSEVLDKVVPANMGFVNYSGLKLSPDFQNTQNQAR